MPSKPAKFTGVATMGETADGSGKTTDLENDAVGIEEGVFV